MLRAAWKSLLGRKVRLLMSTFAIVLGVGFVAGTFLFTDTLSRSFTAIFASSVGDVVVRPHGGTTSDNTPSTLTVPASLVARIARVDGAARADGNVASFGVFVVGKNNKVIGGNGPPGLAFNDSDAPAAHGVQGLSIMQGEHPHGPDEVALDASTAEKAGYSLGEEVHLISAGKRALLTPTLVGIADFPEGGSLNGATVSIFDTPTAQDLFLEGKDVYNNVWVTAAEGVSQRDLAANVRKVVPARYDVVTGDKAADQAASQLLQAISFINTFFLVFAAIALVVGGFLIVNTFSILVAQRSRELALLRALGASRRQVTRSVIFEAFVLGLLGSTLGLGVGVLIAMGIKAFFASFGLDLSGAGLVFEPRTAVVAYAVGILVTVVAAYLPARRSSRIPPVAALRDDVAMPEASIRKRLLVGTAMVVVGAGAMVAGLFASVPKPGYWVGGGILAALLGVAAASPVVARPFLVVAALVYRRVFGTVGTLAGQNALRNPRRTAATASALMIGLALVTTMAIVGASSKASVDKSVEENFVGDFVISNIVGTPMSPQIAREVRTLPGVDSVARLRWGVAEVAGDRQGLMGIDPTQLSAISRVSMVAGSFADLDDHSVVVLKRAATGKGLSVGDTMTWKMPAGTRKLRVVGIFESNPILYFPYVTTIEALTEAGFQKADSMLIVDRARGADPATVQATLEEATRDLPTVTVKDEQGFAAEQRQPIDRMLTLIYAMLALALVIAILGIVNTLALSIIERTREVGLLRAVGLGRRQLRRMVGLESVVIAVLGTVLGVGMGVIFGVTLMTSLRDEGLEAIVVPYGQLLGFVGTAVVVGVLAAIFPARRAARLDVLRAISSE